jgi:glycopeptide antibiotics resistance protein
MKKRSRYLALIAVIILLGLLSRRAPAIPGWTGDMLYALMMFFIVRFCVTERKTISVAGLSLGICFAIECSQLYQATWINDLRRILPGRLVLGQGFLWTDLIAYTAGVLLGAATEKGMRISGR